jgi:gluconolactonase
LNIGGADGLCVDSEGGSWWRHSAPAASTVFSPDGDLLGAVSADDPMTTNMTLSADGDTLFVTLASSGRLMIVENWVDVAGIKSP